MTRVVNFGAGPCTLPLEVLEAARDEFVDYHGAGMSLIEMSHRSAAYDAVHEGAMSLARSVFEVPDDVDVLFLQGGASLQFAMVPMNLLHGGAAGGYVVTGTWGRTARADAAHHGAVYTAWSGEDGGFVRVPDPGEIAVSAGTRYLHVTSNETINGVRFPDFPDVGVPLVADMSSDFVSRRIPWDRFDLVYGGAQKNLGPAGVTVVFVRSSTLEGTNRDLAAYLRYDVHRTARSLYNTPPVFAVYMMGKVLQWMADRGGLDAIEAAAAEKAGILYGAIDASGGFYRNPVVPEHRSLMNVVFRLPSAELEAAFLAGAAPRRLSGLKGHRSVGGVRASIYNAMPVDGVAALAAYMADFRAANE